MSKMQRKLTLELGYEPSVTELADALEMSEDKVMEIMQIAREPDFPGNPRSVRKMIPIWGFRSGQQCSDSGRQR